MDTQNIDPQPNEGVEVLQNLETLIKTNTASLEKGRIELKKLKEMLSDMFLNDPTYQEHDKAAKEAAKIKSKTKSELLKQPQAADLNKKVKDLTLDMKEIQNSMSDYLREYQRLSGSTEIEGEDGSVMQIIMVAKLVKPSKKFK